MRLVLLALSRPLTVIVALIAVALASILAIQRMPVDIFPQVGDPAIYVAQPYGGMDPAQMEGFLTYYYEYHFLYITGIDGRNDRLRESRTCLHAAGNGTAFCNALRCG
jgi:multidrug efflux pump subunit AcrB